MHFQVSNFSFFGQQRKLHDNENFLNYGIHSIHWFFQLFGGVGGGGEETGIWE